MMKTRTGYAIAFLLAFPLGIFSATAQPAEQSPPVTRPADHQQKDSGGPRVFLDGVAAVVNGELILESDVNAELRFAAFQPLGAAQPTRERLMERLIDRTLILQQMKMQPMAPIEDRQVDAQILRLRKTIPKCAAYHCDTDAGWKKFVEDHGFTVQEVRERWRQRMEVLAYIEERFRMGITVQQSAIDDYYQKTMLPAYAREKVAAPAEAAIADRIREVLLQQQVDKLLDDWLNSLRAQGSVVVMQPGERTP